MLSEFVAKRKTRNVCWSVLACEKHQQDPGLLLKSEVFSLGIILPQLVLPTCTKKKKGKGGQILSFTVQMCEWNTARVDVSLPCFLHPKVMQSWLQPSSPARHCAYLMFFCACSMLTKARVEHSSSVLPSYQPSPGGGLKCSLSLGVALLECQR